VEQRPVRREGFHRTLHISLVPRQSWLKRSGHCEVVVMQLLSSSLFADTFQLEDLTRKGGASPLNSLRALVRSGARRWTCTVGC
jgi:hypothetical protein